MAVEVRLPTILRPHVGGRSLRHGRRVHRGRAVRRPRGAATRASRASSITESGDLHKFVNVYRNDDDIRYTGRLDTPVAENDVVSIIPAVAGG